MVLGLNAAKSLVAMGNDANLELSTVRSLISFSSFSCSIQKGGMRVICACDLRPTLQPYFSSMAVLYARIFSSRCAGSTSATKYMLTIVIQFSIVHQV